MLNLKDKENLSILITLLILVFCLIVINNYLSKKFKFALLIETSQKETESYLQSYMSKRKQIKELRKFIKKHPHTSEVIDKYIELGKIFKQIKSGRHAYWTYKSAIRKERNNPEIIKIYLLLINSLKDKKSALFKIYRDVSKRFPDDRRLADIYKKYAKMLEERKQKEEALKFYEIAAKYASRKEKLSILEKSAKVCLASGDNQKALEIYNKILNDFTDIVKDKTQVLEQIALINESMGNYQKSLEIYKNIVKKDPKYLGRYFHIARLEELLGKSDTATEIYNDIIANNPDTIWAKNAAGEFWVRDKSRECPKKVYHARAVDSPPRIDGELSERCWQTPQKATGFADYIFKKEVTQQTEVMVTYDKERIYFAYIMREENLGGLLAERHKNDDKVWRDDCNELFLDVNRDYSSYHQMVINPAETYSDGSSPGGHKQYSRSWDGDWKVSTKIYKNKKYWIIEFSIGYKSLGAKPPQKGAVWGVNFNRARRAGSVEISCWADIGSCNHTPERFGYLVFE